MIEFFLVLYAFSGLIKSILISLNIDLPIDFTLLTGLSLITLVGYNYLLDFKSNTQRIFKKPKIQVIGIVSLILFYIWILFSVSQTDKLEYPKIKAFYFLTNLITVFLLFLYSSSKLNIKKFSLYFIYFSLAFAIFYFVTSPNSKYYDDTGQYLFDYTNFRSTGMLIGLKCGVASLLMIRYMKKKYWWATLFVFMIFTLFYTSSRGSLLILLFLLLLLLISKRKTFSLGFKQFSKNYFLKAVGALILLVLIISTMILLDDHKMNTLRRATVRMEILANQVLKIESDDDNSDDDSSEEKQENEVVGNPTNKGEVKDMNRSINTRIWHYKWSLNQMKNPGVFFTGIGFGTYGYYCCGYDDRTEYPHNIFVETFVELGIIGFILFSIFIILVFISWYRNPQLFVFGFCFLFLLINTLKSFSLVDIKELFLYSSILLFFTSDLKFLKPNKE